MIHCVVHPVAQGGVLGALRPFFSPNETPAAVPANRDAPPQRTGNRQTRPARKRSPDAAQQYTRWLATHHYENFNVVSWLLPKELHQYFYNIYAYCRWADDLGDEVPIAPALWSSSTGGSKS